MTRPSPPIRDQDPPQLSADKVFARNGDVCAPNPCTKGGGSSKGA